MKKNIIIFLAFIGFLTFLVSCEKDGNKITMLTNPIAPSFASFPSNLTFSKNIATDTVQFVGVPVNPGFKASATYILEACAQGDGFHNVTTLYSGNQDTLIKFAVSNLNQLLLVNFIEDQASSMDFRIRAILTVDAGTGAQGTSTNPFEYISNTNNANVYLYGLPRLDLIGSGITQKVVSPNGDGTYTQFVKLNSTKPFTLNDPVTNTSYGGSGGTLTVNGSAISAGNSGWYKLSVDVNKHTYTLDEYQIGLIGSATPNGWNSPDQKMDFNTRKGYWYITLNLIDGEIKFRKNDGWAWNLGGTTSSLTQGGANLPITAGNYTITLNIVNDLTGSCSLNKN